MWELPHGAPGVAPNCGYPPGIQGGPEIVLGGSWRGTEPRTARSDQMTKNDPIDDASGIIIIVIQAIKGPYRYF